jgi:hypothetical protein
MSTALEDERRVRPGLCFSTVESRLCTLYRIGAQYLLGMKTSSVDLVECWGWKKSQRRNTSSGFTKPICEEAMTEIPELTANDLARALPARVRKRLMLGQSNQAQTFLRFAASSG